MTIATARRDCYSARTPATAGFTLEPAMPLPTDAVQSLNALIAADAGLRDRLLAANDRTQAGRILAEAAVAQGWSVTTEDIAKLVSVHAEPRPLNDDELAGTAGGVLTTRSSRSPFENG